jgi:Fic family protein
VKPFAKSGFAVRMSNMSKYSHVRLVNPPFDSKITDLIINLDILRKRQLGGTTHPQLFFQMKSIFHILESIGSARIEGNHTTLAEYIESRIDGATSSDEKIREIQNMNHALNFVEDVIDSTAINRAFVSELHKKVVDSLRNEGSTKPGSYRKVNLRIAGSHHVPPDYSIVNDLMDELFSFINSPCEAKYDLLKTAITHHRFAWIHPFDNGNGRTVRLLTYAMLVKQGFNVHKGRIINPTAVFCMNRNAYYDALAEADGGNDSGILKWCEYMLSGLATEIEKIDKLLDYNFLANHILIPAIRISAERELITETELKILNVAVKKQVFQASDLGTIFPGKSPPEVSRQIRKLREKNMIKAESAGGRKYLIAFLNNYLMRGVFQTLDKKGFLPIKNEI